MGHFSPRPLAAAMSRTVTRRLLWPPYRAFSGGTAGAGAREEPAGEEAEDMERPPWPRGALVASPDRSIMTGRAPKRHPRKNSPEVRNTYRYESVPYR